MEKTRKLWTKEFLSLFLSLLLLEIIFKLVYFGQIEFLSFIRIILFVLCLSFVLSFLLSYCKKERTAFIAGFLIVLVFATYGFVELEFKHFLHNFYSFSSVGDGALRIKQYVFYFLKDALPSYYLCFLSVPVYISVFLLSGCKTQNEGKGNHLPILLALVCYLGCFSLLSIKQANIDLLATYLQFSNPEILIDNTGILHYFFRDLSAIFIKADDSFEAAEEELIEEAKEETELTEEKPVRQFDDSEWIMAMEKEESSTIKNIDSYLLSRNIGDYNQRSGEFKDYNLIYFLVESFDYLAIDEELTPTLYRMYKEGYSFSDHYTPKYSCTTGESEFIALTSLVPYNDVCTPNGVLDKDFNEALPYLFKRAGYDTFSFHNWNDQFYNRSLLHQKMGFDAYYDIDDLDIKLVNGWQSDTRLVEEAFEYFKDSDRFFSFIITSVMHWPYDESSYYGDLHLKTINEVHPEYPSDIKRYLSKSMEFDHSLERLLELLEESGKSDNTIICLFSDHHPFKLSTDSIVRYSSNTIDRNEPLGTDKTPFIIYNPKLTPTSFAECNSTFDQVPTLANLFGLDYDPRLYVGSDIFDGNTVAIYPNGSWIVKEGYYSLGNNSFTPWNDEALSEEEIKTINAKVQNLINVSHSIMSTNYFAKRPFLANPNLQNK